MSRSSGTFRFPMTHRLPAWQGAAGVKGLGQCPKEARPGRRTPRSPPSPRCPPVGDGDSPGHGGQLLGADGDPLGYDPAVAVAVACVGLTRLGLSRLGLSRILLDVQRRGRLAVSIQLVMFCFSPCRLGHGTATTGRCWTASGVARLPSRSQGGVVTGS